MRAAARTSARVCTPPSFAQFGFALITAKPRATVDFKAYPNMPASPAGTDADYFAAYARRVITELQAMVILASQIHEAMCVPTSLAGGLIESQLLLRQRVCQLVDSHKTHGGAETAQLLVELNAVRGTT